ncbi:putative secreted protein [Streptomyces avermitilis MA-4680 = NBRC 14893]|uniref:Secreted protein n=2 Tax=Streptomyces avermitilis TaxID=33903 RepID=Q828D8_STRAW|nr:putative secreted protein [Streptomyces avermitilis MA-4680 = NBRC 14893]BBJ55009.1 hypothetical protein SAVMC3_76380 [Streptomyces avermitilis]
MPSVLGGTAGLGGAAVGPRSAGAAEDLASRAGSAGDTGGASGNRAEATGGGGESGAEFRSRRRLGNRGDSAARRDDTADEGASGVTERGSTPELPLRTVGSAAEPDGTGALPCAGTDAEPDGTGALSCAGGRVGRGGGAVGGDAAEAACRPAVGGTVGPAPTAGGRCGAGGGAVGAPPVVGRPPGVDGGTFGMRLAKGRSYDGGIPGRGFRAAGRGTARRGTAEGGSCGTGGTAPSVSREVACPSREAGPVGGGVVGRGGTAGRGGMEARRASVLMHPPFRCGRAAPGPAGGVRPPVRSGLHAGYGKHLAGSPATGRHTRPAGPPSRAHPPGQGRSPRRVRVTLRVDTPVTGTSPHPRGICPERPPTLR